MKTKKYIEHTARCRGQGLRRILLTVAGSILLAAGVIGIFVPVWPTTCFLLLAAACFARSSHRMSAWVNSNRFFGKHLRRYRESGTIDHRIRAGSLISLWASLTASALILQTSVWPTLLLLAVGAAVTLHLYFLSAFATSTPVKPR